MYDLVIIGHVGYDDTTNFYGERSIVASGAAYLSAVGASFFSKRIGIVSRIGEDYDFAHLERLEIDLSGVKVVKGGLTARFFQVYKTPDHSIRDFSAQLNVGQGIVPGDVPIHYLDSKFIHIATMPPYQQKPFIQFLRKNTNAIISIDTLEQYIEAAKEAVWDNFQAVDICFIDKREHALLDKLIGTHRTSIVVKRGAEGAEFISIAGIVSVPAPKVDRIVDKTGSGDILAGAFLALLAKGEGPPSALEKAVHLASRSIESFGVDHLLVGRAS